MSFKKSLAKVFSVNLLQLISSLIVGFFVPAVLSIEGYASLKTYTLYMSYIGLLHLGFIDGLYIKYGGKKYEEIDKGTLKSEHIFLVVFQFIISIIFFIVSLLTKNIIIFLFSISILPYMLHTFFKNIFQATGNFEKYSKIMYIYTFTYIILNITLAILLKNDNYIIYCLTTFISNIVSVFAIEIMFLKELKGKKITIKKEILNNIKVGFFILLGNLIVIGLFGIDKWFVKLFLSTEDFAYYSFAVSMLNLINTLINAISITFYNYLFENNDEEKINRLKKYLMILGGFASTAYFALAFIVEFFIEKYVPSLEIIAITFSVFPYMILINALYINLYKVNKKEKHYFKVVLMILLISIIYNIIALILFHNTITIAIATLITLITWVIYSTKDLKKVVADKKMYIYLFGITIIFLISAHYLNWLTGAIIYLISYIIWTFLVYKDVCIDMKNELIKQLNKK